jgi:hypothetical protein
MLDIVTAAKALLPGKTLHLRGVVNSIQEPNFLVDTVALMERGKTTYLRIESQEAGIIFPRLLLLKLTTGNNWTKLSVGGVVNARLYGSEATKIGDCINVATGIIPNL